MVKLEIQAFDSHELFTVLIRLDASEPPPPFLPELQPGFEDRNRKSSANVFETQTTKLLGESYMPYTSHLLHDLDTCYYRPRPPNHQVLLHL